MNSRSQAPFLLFIELDRSIIRRFDLKLGIGIRPPEPKKTMETEILTKAATQARGLAIDAVAARSADNIVDIAVPMGNVFEDQFASH